MKLFILQLRGMTPLSTQLWLSIYAIHIIWKGVVQGRTEVRWRPGQETSLAPPCLNLRSFRSKRVVMKKLLETLLVLFGASLWFSARGVAPPFVSPLDWWQHTSLSESNTHGERLWFNSADTDTNVWARFSNLTVSIWRPSTPYSANTPQIFSILNVKVDIECASNSPLKNVFNIFLSHTVRGGQQH